MSNWPTTIGRVLIHRSLPNKKAQRLWVRCQVSSKPSPYLGKDIPLYNLEGKNSLWRPGDVSSIAHF